MTADTTTVPANLAVRAALEVCQVLRNPLACSGPMSIETLVARTGLERNAVLWGIRVLEDEDLVDVHPTAGGSRVQLRATWTRGPG